MIQSVSTKTYNSNLEGMLMFPLRSIAHGLGTILSLMFFCCGQVESPYLSLEVAEQEIAQRHLLHVPEDGYHVMVNPPGFTWTAHSDAAIYRFLLFREAELEQPYRDLDDLSSTVAVLDAPLEPGEYVWCVAYRDSAGKSFGRSKLRKFIVRQGLVELPMPDVAQIADKLQSIRPRIFLLPAEVDRIKTAIAENRLPFWELCRKLADMALSEPLYPEPAPYKDRRFEVNEWRRIYTPGKVGSSHAVRLALAYRLTGERKYLE